MNGSKTYTEGGSLHWFDFLVALTHILLTKKEKNENDGCLHVECKKKNIYKNRNVMFSVDFKVFRNIGLMRRVEMMLQLVQVWGCSGLLDVG